MDEKIVSDDQKNLGLPQYPIYIPTKNRSSTSFTAKCLVKDGVPFRLVVEAPEKDAYGEKFGHERLLVLPEIDKGLVFARNWIRDHAAAEGYVRHWQLDDNMRTFRRWFKGKRIPCNAGFALSCVEDFVDRYENVAIAGLDYTMFCVPQNRRGGGAPPFIRNCRVYSCTLFLNSLPYRWRGWYNDDVDICLQVLAGGWCTVLVKAFMVDKIMTMALKGGMTDHPEAGYVGDGRTRMARSIERAWPHVVKTTKKFQRAQHDVAKHWRQFDTPLKLKPGISLDDFEKVDERGLELMQVKTVKHPSVQKLIDDAREGK